MNDNFTLGESSRTIVLILCSCLLISLVVIFLKIIYDIYQSPSTPVNQNIRPNINSLLEERNYTRIYNPISVRVISGVGLGHSESKLLTIEVDAHKKCKVYSFLGCEDVKNLLNSHTSQLERECFEIKSIEIGTSLLSFIKERNQLHLVFIVSEHKEEMGKPSVMSTNQDSRLKNQINDKNELSITKQLLSLKEGDSPRHYVINNKGVMNEAKLLYSSFGECSVCLDAIVSRAILPCRHACLCSYCCVRVDKCPLCNSPISSVLRLE